MLYIFKGVLSNIYNFIGGDKYITLPRVIVAINMLIDNIEKLIFELDAKLDRNVVDEWL